MSSRVHQAHDHAVERGLAGGTEQHRTRILKAALHLLSTGGRDSLTTRAVAEAARVQPPVLYRLFRDKAELLEAVAEYGFGLYLARKPHRDLNRNTGDPAEALRQGWRTHVDFGLSHPELYLLMYANLSENRPHPAAAETYAKLLAFLTEVAASGRLRFSVEESAHLCHSAACGTVMMLLNTPPHERNLQRSELACDMAIAGILRDVAPASSSPLKDALLVLQAQFAQSAASPLTELLSPAESALMLEWLDRLGTALPLRHI